MRHRGLDAPYEAVPSDDDPSQRLGQALELLEEPLEAGEVERLGAVGEGVVGIGVDLDQRPSAPAASAARAIGGT